MGKWNSTELIKTTGDKKIVLIPTGQFPTMDAFKKSVKLHSSRRKFVGFEWGANINAIVDEGMYECKIMQADEEIYHIYNNKPFIVIACSQALELSVSCWLTMGHYLSYRQVLWQPFATGDASDNAASSDRMQALLMLIKNAFNQDYTCYRCDAGTQLTTDLVIEQITAQESSQNLIITLDSVRFKAYMPHYGRVSDVPADISREALERKITDTCVKLRMFALYSGIVVIWPNNMD